MPLRWSVGLPDSSFSLGKGGAKGIIPPEISASFLRLSFRQDHVEILVVANTDRSSVEWLARASGKLFVQSKRQYETAAAFTPDLLLRRPSSAKWLANPHSLLSIHLPDESMVHS